MKQEVPRRPPTRTKCVDELMYSSLRGRGGDGGKNEYSERKKKKTVGKGRAGCAHAHLKGVCVCVCTHLKMEPLRYRTKTTQKYASVCSECMPVFL